MKKVIALFLSVLMVLSFCSAAFAEEADVSGFRVSSPNGAPGIALAFLAVENPDHYTYLSAETITAEFTNGDADFIIAPINAGAKLFLKEKSTYRLAAVLAWGNLFFASQRENFTLDDINGAEITLFGEDTINASVVLYSLEQNGIKPEKVSYLAGAANTQQLLLTDPEAIVVTAEPALTAACGKNDKITGYPVNDLYKAATGSDGYTQAGLFVKAELAENQPEAVDAYLKLAEESCTRCSTDLDSAAAAAAALEILPNENVAKKAIPGCAIRYMAAPDARDQIEMTAGIDIKQFGGSLPSDAFYYGAE